MNLDVTVESALKLLAGLDLKDARELISLGMYKHFSSLVPFRNRIAWLYRVFV